MERRFPTFSDIQLPEMLAAEQPLARRLAVIGSSRRVS